jgi:nitrite reductase (NADH) small subunit
MSFFPIGSAGLFPTDAVREVRVAGEPFAVCNVNGTLHAVSGTCPHAGGPLGQGALQGNMLVCPWHAWEFDCRTGEHDYNSAIAVRTIPLHVLDGEVSLDIS